MDPTLFERYEERAANTTVMATETLEDQMVIDEEEENHDPSLVCWRNLADDNHRLKVLSGFDCEHFLSLFELLEGEFPTVMGRGRRSEVSNHDKLLIALCYLRHYETLDKLKETFKISKTHLKRILDSTLAMMEPILYTRFVEDVEADLPDDNEDFPEARYVMDVTFQTIWMPLGTYAERKRFYSGKHKQYGLKSQCIHDRSGRLVHCIAGIPGAVHDLTIARQSIDEKEYQEDMEEEDEEELWSILVDSGYQGLQHVLPAVLPHKRRAGRALLRAERDHNRRQARHRVVCEHFYGRLKAKWRIMTSKYRSDRDDYAKLFRLCAALTQQATRQSASHRSETSQ